MTLRINISNGMSWRLYMMHYYWIPC